MIVEYVVRTYVNGAVNKIQQKEAAARLVDQKEIFEAAKHGDFCVIMDHVILNPNVVHQRDYRYVYEHGT